MAINIYEKIKTLENSIRQKKVELNYYKNMQKQLEEKLTVQEILELKLTPHQKRIAELIKRGMTNEQISTTLDIHVKTIKYHLTHLYAYLNCNDRKELIQLLNEVYIEPKNAARIPEGPAYGSTQAVLGRLSSGQETSGTGVSLPFGTTR